MNVKEASICAGVFIVLSTIQCNGQGRQASTTAKALAFIDVDVIPMDEERVLEGLTVIVRADRIESIGPLGDADVPADATIIDGAGRFLMPGLADMHTHTSKTDEFIVLIANGVTTIRNMFGDTLHLNWQKQIAAGELLAPAIYTAGPIIDGEHPIWPSSDSVVDVEQADSVVDRQSRAGYDFLKVYWGLTREAYDAIIAAAEARNMPVVGHVPWAVDLEHALESGLRSIEHLTGYEYYLGDVARLSPDTSIWALLDETRFDDIAERTARAGVWNCPTLVLYQSWVAPGEDSVLARMLSRPEMVYVSHQDRESWLPENNYLAGTSPRGVASVREGDEVRKRLVKALHHANARLLLGTDYPNPFVVPGFSVLDELENLVDAGLTPYEAIRAGTSGAAEFIGAVEKFGRIAVGLRADLLLLEANPLEDVANVRKRAGVMVRGQWFEESELQIMLADLASKLAAEPTEELSLQE